MGEMGLRAYRLSISWPRVLPERTGTVDQAGVDFYNRLVDTLLEQQIEPWVTLFHWDYPAALFDRGGWLNRDSIPETRSSADIDAARRATMSVTAQDVQNNTWFADPLFLGVYPSDALELYGERMPAIPDADMATIRQPLDFCGFNAYAGETIRATGDGGWTSVAMSTGAPLTTMGWQVTPDVLYWGCRFFHERYGRPVVITENGMANCDWIQQDARVHDSQRIDFLRRYIRSVAEALDDGIEVEGYFIWSVMDNFEWAHGYKQRFGLVFVDCATQARTLKDSAYWYRDIIAAN